MGKQRLFFRRKTYQMITQWIYSKIEPMVKYKSFFIRSQRLVLNSVIRYEIRLQTGSMYNAGTNEPVWITLYGMRGTMITKYLEIAENEFYPFEPESNDIFVLYDIDLGEVKSRNRF